MQCCSARRPTAIQTMVVPFTTGCQRGLFVGEGDEQTVTRRRINNSTDSRVKKIPLNHTIWKTGRNFGVDVRAENLMGAAGCLRCRTWPHSWVGQWTHDDLAHS